MAYIPKNKVKINLYTKGSEFILSNQQEYIGPYYKLYNGKFYSGATPNDPNSVELFPYTINIERPGPFIPNNQLTPFSSNEYSSSIAVDDSNFEPTSPLGDSILPFDFPPVNVSPYPILPTPQDYKLGVFTRYFKIKRNQSVFQEINKKDYDTFQQGERTRNNLDYLAYRVFSLPWELTGDPNKVAQTNKNITELAESRQKALGLGLFLKENWLQFYKETP